MLLQGLSLLSVVVMWGLLVLMLMRMLLVDLHVRRPHVLSWQAGVWNLLVSLVVLVVALLPYYVMYCFLRSPDEQDLAQQFAC